MSDQIPSLGAAARPGPILRQFRIERGLTLTEVSERTGLPISSLSKIENGKMELTIDKLLRISLALDINIADVLGTPTNQYASTETSRRRCITRAGQGEVVASPSGEFCYHAYELLSKDLTPIVAEIRARSIEEFGEFHRHPGEEYVYVLEGELALYSDTYTPAHLKKGDSIYFDGGMGHAYVAVGEGPCRILSIFSSSATQVVDMVEGRKPLMETLAKFRSRGEPAA